jgi:putative membrane protein
MYLFLLMALLICIVIVLFAVQNAALVTVTFLAFNFTGSLALILVIVFALGVLSGMLMTVPSFWRKSAALREQKRRVKQLEESAAVKPAPQAHGAKGEERNHAD